MNKSVTFTFEPLSLHDTHQRGSPYCIKKFSSQRWCHLILDIHQVEGYAVYFPCVHGTCKLTNIFSIQVPNDCLFVYENCLNLNGITCIFLRQSRLLSDFNEREIITGMPSEREDLHNLVQYKMFHKKSRFWTHLLVLHILLN